MAIMMSLRRTSSAALVACAALLLPLAPTAQAAPAADRAGSRPTEAAVNGLLDGIRHDPARLDAFLRAMPKGGDLHNHLSGAVTTELLIRLAAQDDLCIDSVTLDSSTGPCQGTKRPAADALAEGEFRTRVIRAWSMQDFTPGAESGHDHFFATFGKFGEASWRHPGTMIAEVTDTMAAQHQSYLETMLTPASGGVAALAAKVGFEEDFAALRQKLLADGQMQALVDSARADLDTAMAEYQATEHCGTAQARPGCSVTVRIQSQASRASTPARVFAQLLIGLELASQDDRFVAVNLVQPEDYQASLDNYRLQMRMLEYLRPLYPKAHVSLHAGELVPGLVKPEDLTFHIRQAVLTGRAERIGHGVDVTHEDDSAELLRTLAERKVLVEVPLTSNAQILQVEGREHPFPLYRKYGVPTALATDDPGVERIDITHEYVRAARTYGLSYTDLKDLARNSLEYGFVAGRSLWRDRNGFKPVPECQGRPVGSENPLPKCAALLAASPKAALEWKQEGAFRTFEASVLHLK
ncbi:adenosine deaminase [Kitasatospora sp. NA04385]|uniref:adenosine deaminase family protein n=1 Tax=Kitasatospora sp. NA04385 TaxID=2742135 RepID=UPI0015908B35|nr:adenosine deaminase [Kitasatospora sp. NA04385]QKW22546.1 adenosine deaminase [Kitasatospora sp. NA04385]